MSETTQPINSATMQRGRVAVSLCFLTFGMAVALWFVHVPVVVERLGLPPGLLGLALFCIGAVGLITQPLAAIIVGRYGARRVVMVLLPATIAASFLTIISLPFLCFCFVVLVGLVATPAMSEATHWPRITKPCAVGRRCPPSTASWLGGLISAVLGGVLIGAGLGDGRGAFFVDGTLFLVSIWAASNAIDNGPQPTHPPTSQWDRVSRSRRSRYSAFA